MLKLAIAALLVLSGLLGTGPAALAGETPPPGQSSDTPSLATQLGADERGMRHYVLVILKTGAHRMPDGPQRKEMFNGHFANIQRLADAGKLVVAGPFEDGNDWRGLFVFAVDNIEAAKALVATDPVIVNGEMVAEYHLLYSSAALMTINDTHKKITGK